MLKSMPAYDHFAWFYDRYWNEEFHSAAFPIFERILLPRLQQRARILDEWNRTAVAYPRDAAIHELFSEVAERAIIQRTLMQYGYSRARTAKSLGISRVTLYKKMRKFGLMDVPFSSASSR